MLSKVLNILVLIFSIYAYSLIKNETLELMSHFAHCDYVLHKLLFVRFFSFSPQRNKWPDIDLFYVKMIFKIHG